MELVLTQQDTEPLPKTKKEFAFNTKCLLNSNYKSVAEQSLSNSSTASVFGVKQHLKFKRFSVVNHIDVVLKLSVFVMALAMLF